MLRGASEERNDEFAELVETFHKEHRYPGREEEVAARIVNKQRTEFGETQAAQEADAHGRSPDRSLPVDDYDSLTADEVVTYLPNLERQEVEQIRRYESKHRNRTTLLEAIDRYLER